MALNKNNVQVCVTLPKEIVDKLDIEANEELRTRSKQVAKIVIDYYRNKSVDTEN